MPPKRRQYIIIPLDPATGEMITQPKPLQPVVYAIRYPRSGRLKPIKVTDSYGKKGFPNIVAYSQRDVNELQRIIQERGNTTFVAYEQKTARNLRDPKTGKIVKSPDGDPYKLVRLRGPSRRANQRGVLYSRGGRKRALDIGYRPWHERAQVDATNYSVISPRNDLFYEFAMQGKTIKEALQKIVINIDHRKLAREKKHVLFSFFVKIVDKKTGAIFDIIPASGSVTASELRGRVLRGEDVAGFRELLKAYLEKTGVTPPQFPTVPAEQIEVMANMYSSMSYAIRVALAHGGWSFTELVTLDKIAQREFGTADPELLAGSDEEDYNKLYNVGRAKIDVRDLSQVQPQHKAILALHLELI